MSLPSLWRSFTLTAGLPAPFLVSGLFISIKIPFDLEAVSWVKFSSYSTFLSVGNFTSFHGVDPFFLSWPGAEHPSVRKVCCLSRNCLCVAFCMTDGIWEVDITALGMSSAVWPTKEKVWVQCWAGSDHGAFTETETHLIWIKGFLRSFRQKSSDRGCRTRFYFLSVVPEVWRHKALHRVRFGSLTPQFKWRNKVLSKAWGWNHVLRVPSWL